MGDLVAGIGDEVLLFAAFFLLSILVVSLISRWRQQGQRPAQSQGPESQDRRPETQDHRPESQDLRPETREESARRPSDSERGEAISTSQSLTSTDKPSEGELRSRFHPGSPGSGTKPSSTAEASEEQQARGSEGSSISVRLVLPQSSLTVSVLPSSTLAGLRSTHFQQHLAENRQVRFIYRGRILSNDTQTLQELEITNNSALHVHIGTPRPQGAAENHQEQDVLDISGLFVPLFGTILAATWVAMFCFPHIFSLMTKLFLFALSLGYVVLSYVTVVARQ